MARIRTIKPEFPHSESMGRVSRDARLLFVLMWTLADDSGRLRGNSRILASLLFPYDSDAGDLTDGWLDELEVEGCIARYLIDGSTYVEIRNWLKHQKIDKPSASKIGPFDDSSRIVAKTREESSGDQGSRIKDLDQGPRTKGPGSLTASRSAPRPELPEFEHLKSLYPKRAGDQRWPHAAKALSARMAEGYTWDEILAGVERYATYLRASGKIGTEYVQQAATFLGPNKGFLHPWTPPPTAQAAKSAARNNANFDAYQAVVQQIEQEYQNGS